MQTLDEVLEKGYNNDENTNKCSYFLIKKEDEARKQALGEL